MIKPEQMGDKYEEWREIIESLRSDLDKRRIQKYNPKVDESILKERYDFE